MFLIQSCIDCCAARSASSCVVIGSDVLHFAFGGLYLNLGSVAHDLYFDLEGNYFGTGDGGAYGGTWWTSYLRQSLIL